MTDSILRKIKKVLLGFPELGLAIIYGSFATGNEKATSDIDIAIAANSKISIEELVKVQTQLSNATSREIDLIDLNAATGTVFKEALTKGVTILKLDDELYAKILSRMLFQQADFEPLRNRILEARRKKVLG